MTIKLKLHSTMEVFVHQKIVYCIVLEDMYI